MSDTFWDENDDAGNTGPKALRDQLDKLKAELKEQAKELEKAKSENAELVTKVKATTFRDALSDAGIDPKYARFAERDGVEPTAEAVKQWVEDNRDVYAFLQKSTAPSTDEVTDEEQGDEVVEEDQIPEELAEAIRQGQATEGVGRPSGSSTVVKALEQAQANLDQFKTEEEVDNYLRSLGAPRRVDLE